MSSNNPIISTTSSVSNDGHALKKSRTDQIEVKQEQMVSSDINMNIPDDDQYIGLIEESPEPTDQISSCIVSSKPLAHYQSQYTQQEPLMGNIIVVHRITSTQFGTYQINPLLWQQLIVYQTAGKFQFKENETVGDKQTKELLLHYSPLDTILIKYMIFCIYFCTSSFGLLIVVIN
jgi:hypothetical protein